MEVDKVQSGGMCEHLQISGSPSRHISIQLIHAGSQASAIQTTQNCILTSNRQLITNMLGLNQAQAHRYSDEPDRGSGGVGLDCTGLIKALIKTTTKLNRGQHFLFNCSIVLTFTNCCKAVIGHDDLCF